MRLLTSLLLSFIILTAWGQSPYRAPLNPKFTQQKTKKGYVYPPHIITRNHVKMKSAEILPASYDLRNDNGNVYTPPIRNQNPYGACWAFAAMASIESSWKKTGDAAFIDLSEANMAKCHGYVFDIDSGGNQYMATAYLSRLAGPLYESADPYENIADRLCPNADPATDIPYYTDEILWLGNNPELVKQTIYTYGAVATSMKATFSNAYYNSTDHTFFYNGNEGPDHGVTIVGWDDNKVVTGGTAGTPTSAGAWIVRNSWGTSAQDQGYFYASYEDAHIGKESELYHGKVAVNEVDTLFDHAKTGAITSYSAGVINNNYGYAAIKHTTHEDVFITHIGTAVLSEGSLIDLAICKNFNGSSFSDTIATSTANVCNFAGYKKFEIPAFVEPGDFYVVFRYETPGSNFPIPAETTVEEYVYPEIEEGKMWISSDAKVWYAGGKNTSFNFDLAAKVYAKYIDGIQPYFTCEREKACISQTVTFNNKTIGEADSFLWEFPEETIKTISKSESVNYAFASTGEKSLKLTAYKDGAPVEFSKTKAIEIVSSLFPKILVANAAEYYSKGKPITLIGIGGDSYTWYANGYLNGDIGNTITFSPDEDSIWVKMEVTMGQCYASDSTLIRMKDVPYDDIDEALSLSIGVAAENISNEYASVQASEPMPTIGGCSTQNSWCEEGGLQNTIWFKFTAPNSGMASITTTGFDNQIALYDATETGGWEDILSGNTSYYNIIAANDDYHSVDYSAKIEEVSGLTPNKTYWVQMDGSAGGSTGEIRITVNTSVTTIHNISETHKINITNTPHTFLIQGEKLEGIKLKVYNSTGKQIYETTLQGSQNINNAPLTEGFYLISLEKNNYQQTFKAVGGPQWEISIEQR